MKDDDELVIRARAIVSLRNQMRDTLTNIQRHLNSDIDRLEILIKSGDKEAVKKTKEIRDVIGVLNRTWLAKAEMIEIEMRKLLAELGMFENFDDLQPPTASPTAST